MTVELEGSLNDKGMVMDYYDLKKMINPFIEKLDHAFMVYEKDEAVLEFLNKINSKKVIVNFESTVENITKFFLEEIRKSGLPSNIKKVKVRICESPDDYAEEEMEVPPVNTTRFT